MVTAKKEMPLKTTTLPERASKRMPVSEVAPRVRDAEELLGLVQATLADGKAEEIVTIDLASKSSIADFMVIASGRSSRHVGAVANQLLDKLKEEGYRGIRSEGMPQCDWVLVDAGSVVVHVFRPEVREFYNLEKMWSADGPADIRPM